MRKQLLVNEVKYSKFFTEYTEKEEHTVLFLFSLFVYPIYAAASTSLPDPLIALILLSQLTPLPFFPPSSPSLPQVLLSSRALKAFSSAVNG